MGTGFRAVSDPARVTLAWMDPHSPAGMVLSRQALDRYLERICLGAPFSVAVCPFCTPALLVLGGVATVGSPLLAAILLLVFALGRSVPIALGAWAVRWLESLKPRARFSYAFETLGGVAFITAGLYLLDAYFFWVPTLAG